MKLEEKILQILSDNGLNFNIQFSTPPNPQMGDLAFPCFELAKQQGKNPVECATSVKEVLEKSSLQKYGVDKVITAGPYVNFFLNSGAVAKTTLELIEKQSKKYGFNTSQKGKKVIIEYPSNNTHKELHIGHLRNICLGNALNNIFAANGVEITPINYLNDFGAHVAKCLWGLQKFHNNEKPPKGQEQKWLGEIYAEASKYLEDHPELKEESFAMQKNLEARDKSIWPLFKKTRQWSIDGFDKAFKELGLKLSHTFYEQDVKDNGQKIVDELIKKGIATVGEGGAIILDLTSENLDIALLRKSNGAGLYLTSDLGLAVAKNKKYKNISESITLTGSEQNFYFKQLFKVLQKAGYNYKMTHIGYGLVMLPDGKMSSRKGKVILYDDVRDEVYGKILEETVKRHTDWNKKKIAKTAWTVAMAAIKFDFLKHEAAKTIVFDFAAATKFEGFTGPYVLYMVARINSILRKAKPGKTVDFGLLSSTEEKQLIIMLGEYGEAIKKSFNNYNPSVLTKYSFDVAQAFSNFYAKHSVLNNDNKEIIKARLALCSATKQVLQNCLSILSIDTVDEM
ncbi:MAG: arginine--tRNA ligase [Candidatus Magasanikbacteria bacterium]|nr:arginine--tRNA ligase [Candidatus Magasanikbacteria bacterium]